MNTRKQQSGVMLLEAMIAILIFSFGILAIVALQAAAVNSSSDAKYRSDAGLLANQLIGQMRTGDRAPANLLANFQTGGVAYNAWFNTVQATLPRADVNPPAVGVVLLPIGATPTSCLVTITVRWQLPSQAGKPDSVHQYSTIVQVI